MDIDEHFFLGRDDTPTKYTSSDETLHIKCQLRYVDLEGLSDGRSIKTILPQIAPRKLVKNLLFILVSISCSPIFVDYCTWFQRIYR